MCHDQAKENRIVNQMVPGEISDTAIECKSDIGERAIRREQANAKLGSGCRHPLRHGLWEDPEDELSGVYGLGATGIPRRFSGRTLDPFDGDPGALEYLTRHALGLTQRDMGNLGVIIDSDPHLDFWVTGNGCRPENQPLNIFTGQAGLHDPSRGVFTYTKQVPDFMRHQMAQD